MKPAPSVCELDHPLVRHHLSVLRSVDCDSEQFRSQIDRLAILLATEATRDLHTVKTEVVTPLETIGGERLSQKLALVPILRAGLGLVTPLLNMLPEAQVWHLGMYRDEATAQPVEYYCKLPTQNAADVAIVLDPMLATGGSIRAAIGALRRWGVPDIRVLSVIASPEGIEAVAAQFPEVRIFVCRVDRELNARKFILPGLGDAGDRLFNTAPEGGIERPR